MKSSSKDKNSATRIWAQILPENKLYLSINSTIRRW